jgi:hypothetical protein
MPILFFVGAVCLVLVRPPSAPAQSPLSVSLRIGFDGYVTPGGWVPLEVRIDPGEKGIDGEVMVEAWAGSRTNPSVTKYLWPLRVPPGGVFQLSHAIPYVDARWPVRVEVRAGGTVVFAKELRPHPADGLVVVLSQVRGGVVAAGSPLPVVVYAHEEDLPVHPWAYAGVRVLVIHDLSGRRLDEDRRRALLSWVARGGRLLISTGEGFHRIDREALAPLLPAIPTSTKQLPPPRTLAARFGGVFPDPLPVAALVPLPGSSVSLAEGETPLIVERPWGRGEVVMWAFDYLTLPFLRWSGKFSLWRELLEARPRTSGVVTPEATEVLPSSGSLPPGVVLGLGLGMMLYVTVIRWLLRRSTASPSWWLWLLLTAVAFSGGFWAGSTAIRSRGASLAWVSAMEVEGGSGVGVLASYLRRFGPGGGRFELVVPRVLPLVRALPPGSAEVRFEPGAVRVTGSGSLSALEMAGVFPSLFDGWVQRKEGELEVEVVNRSSQPLEDLLLVFQGKVRRLPSLPPGESRWTIGLGQWVALDTAGRERALGRTVLEGALLQWVFPRLPGGATMEERDGPFLLGWVDPRALGVELSLEPPPIAGNPPERVLLILRLQWR